MLKLLVRRHRPERPIGASQAGGYSFPSGHTTGTFVFFGIVPYLLWNAAHRRAAALAAIFSIAITAFVGRSRVALSEHHETDVLGSYAVGALWLALVLRASAGPLGRERARHTGAGKGRRNHAGESGNPAANKDAPTDLRRIDDHRRRPSGGCCHPLTRRRRPGPPSG